MEDEMLFKTTETVHHKTVPCLEAKLLLPVKANAHGGWFMEFSPIAVDLSSLSSVQLHLSKKICRIARGDEKGQ
jgi:hypothetical protein